jgi:hypothetical protein
MRQIEKNKEQPGGAADILEDTVSLLCVGG